MRTGPRRVPSLARSFMEDEHGQSLLEFAIVVPVLVVLLLGIVSVSFYLNAYLTVAQATRVGVRTASLGYPSGITSSGTCPSPGTSGTICAVVDQQLALGAGMSAENLSSICVTAPGTQSSSNLPVVELSLAYIYTPILPVPYLGDPMKLQQTYTMVQETSPPSGDTYASSCS